MKINQKLQKRILGPLTLLHLVLISAAISIVSGAVVLNYDWAINLTASTPDVRFYKWSDGTQANTITLLYNFYADVWMIDSNATYGIKNNAATSKTVYLWIESCSNPTKIANYTLQILNEAGSPQCTWTTTDFINTGESNAVSWAANASKIYAIKVMIKGASTIGNATIQLKLKTSG
jgi:hypothetical protein